MDMRRVRRVRIVVGWMRIVNLEHCGLDVNSKWRIGHELELRGLKLP
jgi:hypothetical protein